MEPKTKRRLLGCGCGCLVLLLAAVGGCVAFQAWLRAPGQLLEPRKLLDAEALGYFEGRLELDNPGTQALFEAGVELMSGAEPPADSPVVRAIWRWNHRRQARELERLFPARMVWTVYPGEVAGETESAFSLSIQRGGHQVLIADWIAGLILPRVPQVPELQHQGERIWVVEEERGESPGEEETPEGGIAPAGDTFRLFWFLRPDGIFVATAEGAARRTVDLLQAQTTPPARGRLLEARLAGIASDRQLRGALQSPNGELVGLVEPLLRQAGGHEPFLEALPLVELLTLGAGFQPSGDVVLDLELIAGDRRQELQPPLENLLRDLAEAWPVEWTVEDSGTALEVTLLIRDLPQLLQEAMDEIGVPNRRSWRRERGP